MATRKSDSCVGYTVISNKPELKITATPKKKPITETIKALKEGKPPVSPAKGSPAAQTASSTLGSPAATAGSAPAASASATRRASGGVDPDALAHTASPGGAAALLDATGAPRSPGDGLGATAGSAGSGGLTGTRQLHYTPGTPQELVAKLETVRARSNARILHQLASEKALEYGREKAMASTSSPGVRRRLAIWHAHQRLQGRQKVINLAVDGEVAMVKAIKELDIRSPAALADYFEPVHGKTREFKPYWARSKPGTAEGGDTGAEGDAAPASPSSAAPAPANGGEGGEGVGQATHGADALFAGIGVSGSFTAADMSYIQRSHKATRSVARALSDFASKEAARISSESGSGGESAGEGDADAQGEGAPTQAGEAPGPASDPASATAAS